MDSKISANLYHNYCIKYISLINTAILSYDNSSKYFMYTCYTCYIYIYICWDVRISLNSNNTHKQYNKNIQLEQYPQ